MGSSSGAVLTRTLSSCYSSDTCIWDWTERRSVHPRTSLRVDAWYPGVGPSGAAVLVTSYFSAIINHS